MPTYEYYCENCGRTEEHVLLVEQRDCYLETPCVSCGTPLRRSCGNKGGFRLGTNGSVGWSSDGYATTWGDSHKFKTGRMP